MSEQTPIAIVGVSALYPGSSDSRGFWRDILAGKDLLGEIPPSHWLIEDYYDADIQAADKTYARRGAFLDEVDFAPMDYGVPPNILAATDTGQLLAMIVAKQLLEDALGSKFDDVDRSRIGVVLGVASTTELCLHMAGRLQQPVWEEGMRRSGLNRDEIDRISEKITDMYVPWEESTFPGLLGNVVSGRIANRFDLGGTNCVVDAACASSLAALEMGINQLSLGQADMMITGGVDALNDILMYMCFSKTGALSKSGDCRPFSSNADGTMLAEGLGMFALKRLEDAERDDDQIYAVVRGVGSSSDGRAKSIYAPRPEGQSKALRRAYEHAGYSPNTVEMVEAHGTATPAGDAAEMRGLQTVFGGESNGEKQWCALGSVKSQIGHAKAAAGAAGLFKTVMALNDRILPPTIKVDAPNPDLELDDSPFYVNSEPRPWIRGGDHPRRNAVSAFGFGGTNFHITLEEYTGSGRKAPRRRALEFELVLLSADEPAAVVEQCRQWADELEEEGMLSYLANRSQRDFDHEQPARLAVVAADESELRTKLNQAADAVEKAPKEAFSAPGGIHYGFAIEPGEVAFLFPGQGSQYIGMGARWAMHFDEARKVWDRAAALDFDAESSLNQVVFPPPAFTDDEKQEQKERLTATEWAQPALGATSLSAFALLQEMGLTPACAGGHSYGEVTALCAAGVFDEESMLQVSRKRGELMAAASSTPGAMSAVSAEIDELRELVEKWGVDVVVANHNSPRQCVLSGPTEAIDDVEGRLRDEKISFKRLPVSTAFHSSLVSDSSEPFLDFLKDVDFGEADFPVYANSLAAAYPDDADEMREILANQLASSVRFVEQVRGMYDQGVRTFLEVGPRSTLTKLVGKCLDGKAHHALHVDRRGKSSVETFFGALGRLSVCGVELDFAPLWQGYEEIEDPRQGDDAAFTVALTGTNYGKPYPADEPRPEPDSRPSPPQPAEPTKTPAPSTPAPRPTPQLSTTAETMTNKKSTEKPPRQTTANGTSQSHRPANGAGGATWVDAFREQQRQTAEAHRTFQETTAEAHRAFLQTMESSFQALGRVATGEPAADPARPGRQTSLPPLDEVAPPPRQNGRMANGRAANGHANGRAPAAPRGVDVPTGLAQSAAPAPTAPSVAPPASQPAAASAPAPASAAPASAPPAEPVAEPPAPASAPPAEVDVSALLLDVVADKTGYPKEMLEPEMELEADLGVDSIKQVEIMSQMEEEVPGLPEVDANELADLRTLKAIAGYLDGLLGNSSSTAEAAPAGDSGDEPVNGTPVNGELPDISATLLEVVADKTGYPKEMLEPEMELEADLGVDSIKQVEIMSQMEERVPGLPEIEASELADLRSLDQIASHIEGLMGGRAPRSSSGDRGTEEAAEEDSESDQGHEAIGRYPVRLVDSPACGWAMPGLRAIETVYIVSSNSDLGSALVDELSERGVSCELVEELPQGAGAAIFVDGLCEVERLDEASAISSHALMTARTLAKGDPKCFVTVQNTGGRFRSATGGLKRAWLAGVGALAKTAASEWPDAAVKAIDLAATGLSSQEQATLIADELLAGGPEIEVGLAADGHRVSPVAVAEPVKRKGRRDGLEEDAVLVVSGGAKGVTATSIIELARELPLRFVLLGRSELNEEPAKFHGVDDDAKIKQILLQEAKEEGEKISPRDLQWRARQIRSGREIRDTMRQLEEAGSKARYASVDVRDGDALAALLDDVRSQWGPVSGIIHGAGVLADALIEKKTPEQFDKVFGTKIEGLQALLDATEPDPIELICLFSSVAARSGNPGQSDYAMANEVLNKVAHAEAQRRGPDCRVKSLNWGPWDGGMVTPALKAHFEAEGVVLLPRDRGAEMHVDELLYAGSDDVEVVLGGAVSAEGMNGSHLSRGVSTDIFVDAATHPYLDSHRLRGIPVVPAMLVLEWFTRFAGACCPELVVRQCRDLEVLNGIKLQNFDGDGDLLTLHAESTGDHAFPVLKLELRGGDKIHYRGVVEMAERRDEPGDNIFEEYELDIGESPFSLDEVYGDGKLFHGPDFEVLTELQGLGEGGGAAALKGLREMGWPDEGWSADPAAMDGALQISLLWGLDLIGAQTLPMRMESFTPFVANPSEELLICKVRRNTHSSRKIVADVLIATTGGQPLCELRGVQMFAVPDGV